MRAPPPYLACALAALALAACEGAPDTGASHRLPNPTTTNGPLIRGVTLDARRPPPDSTLPALARMGVTHIALIPFAFMPAVDDPALRFDPDVRWYSESAEGARALGRQAERLGLRLILKPQVWIGHAEGEWSHHIGFETEAEWAAWEVAYRAFLLHHARVAAEVGADVLVVGTELGRSVRTRPAFWRGLIADVRAVFPGRLTYAANWHDDAEHVAFWDALDYIGVQAYFPLAQTDAPDAAALRAGWAEHKAVLRALHERWDRPVLFTEVGYRSVPYAAARPWQWPAHGEAVTPDPALQARLYAETFRAWWPEPWFAGLVLWKWYGQPHADAGHTVDFSPQGKPAEAVLRAWFSRPAGSTGPP